MALSKKDKFKLDIAMGSKKDADKILASMAADETLSPADLKKLEIAMASKKDAAQFSDVSDRPTRDIEPRTLDAMEVMMASQSAAKNLKSEVES